MTAYSNNEQKEDKLLHFERFGGGELNFCIYKTNSDSELNICLKSIDHYPNDTCFIIKKSTETSQLFDTLHALHQQKSILQNNRKPKNSMCTGTWVHMYIPSDKDEYEILNSEILEKLDELENVVRENLNKH